MNSEFFKMASSAVFANPFSDERIEIDRKIIGASADMEWKEVLLVLNKELEKNVHALKNIPEIVAKSASCDDAGAVAVSVLFLVFTQMQQGFDELIETQIEAGNESCEAPCGVECFEKLLSYGFSNDDARRYVGMFYQIRRAYFFISRGLLGKSECMKKLRAQLWNNVFTSDIKWYEQGLWNRMEDFSTLLLGETGTGKGAAAAAIGRSGFIPFNLKTKKFEESFTRAFVSINLSQYPEALIESELFGHRKGAFTGAVEKHDGVFARCSPHGAIFLDEIGDVSVPIQIKLLQILQERTFSPVGSHEKLRFKGRVIAATNRSIDELRREEKFRDDFYYRLCSDIITVPPLRERIAESPRELEMLSSNLMERIFGKKPQFPIYKSINASVGKSYGWPGNVRELEQAIRRIILTGSYTGAQTKASIDFGNTDLSAKELVAKYCADLYEMYGNYGEVARRTGLDWRTVKKYID